MINENEATFDLPETEDVKVLPRVHTAPGESACISCEG